MAALFFVCACPLVEAGDATLRYPAVNDAALHTVCWTGNQFVAAGQGGAIFTSPDGTAWTARRAPLAANWRASAAGGGTIVLTGDSNAVVTSTDGIVWTEHPFGEAVYAPAQVLAWNGGNFLLGWNYTSSDGSVWTPAPAPAGREGLFKGLAVNGGQFVNLESYSVSNADKQRLWTFSGGAWTSAEINAAKLEELTWTGTRYIGVGPGGTAATSVDGISWTPRTTNVTVDLKQVVQGAGLAVAVGNTGVILTSPNGATWTEQNSGTTRNLTSVAWSGARYAAVGDGGLILTSPNGTDWQVAKTGTRQPIYPGFVGWTGPSGLAVGGGYTLYSADGDIWAPTAALDGPFSSGKPHQPRFRMAAGGGRVIMAAGDSMETGPSVQGFGNGGVWSAPLDGSEWTRIPLQPPSEGLTVLWTGTQFAVLGVRQFVEFGTTRYNFFAGTSADGTGWTWAGNNLPNSTDLAWTGQSFMTTSGWYSANGQGWNASGAPDNQYLFWTGDKFIGVTAGGEIRTSADGLTWPAAQFPIVGGADDVIWTGSRLLAVNGYGVYEATSSGPWQTVCRRGGQNIAWTGARALIATGSEIFSLERGGPLRLWPMACRALYPRAAGRCRRHRSARRRGPRCTA